MSGYGSIYEFSWWGYVGKAEGWGLVYPFNSDQIPFTVDTTSVKVDTTQFRTDQTVF